MIGVRPLVLPSSIQESAGCTAWNIKDLLLRISEFESSSIVGGGVVEKDI